MTIKIKNYSLVVFKAPRVSTKPLFESYEIARLLGYSQASSLRKQTLTDWKDWMKKGVHFEMVHDVPTLRRYEKEHEDAGNGSLKLVSSTRGRLFFTPEGMMSVLNRTSKPSEDLRSALERNGFFKGVFGVTIVKDEPKVIPPAPKPAAPSLSKEDRMFEYEVMQKLLEQLERLDNPNLRGLAITAAETALGRELEDLRLGEGVKTIFEAAVPKKPKVVQHPAAGPLFLEEDYYSMTRIGEKAGGYSAKSAGMAANNIAHSYGYTPEQIRNEPLPINQIEMRPDSSTGKKRRMVRFNKTFANQVVAELRGNPGFEPATFARGVPTLSAFSDGSQPLLSRGPFDEDEATRRS
jgi:hypothetical protein